MVPDLLVEDEALPLLPVNPCENIGVFVNGNGFHDEIYLRLMDIQGQIWLEKSILMSPNGSHSEILCVPAGCYSLYGHSLNGNSPSFFGNVQSIQGQILAAIDILPQTQMAGGTQFSFITDESQVVPYPYINLQNYGTSNPGNIEAGSPVFYQMDAFEGFALTNNIWSAVDFNYTITPYTILELDFKSTLQGEVQGFVLDNDLYHSAATTLKLYGTQAYGIDDFQYSGSGNWEHFRIPIGDYFTGSFSKFVFACDNDATIYSDALFKGIRFYEDYCHVPSSPKVKASLSMEEGPMPAQVSTYPNPVHNQLHIQFEGPEGLHPAQLLDLQGRVLWESQLQAGQYSHDISHLPNGIYFLRVEVEGQGTLTRKITKQH